METISKDFQIANPGKIKKIAFIAGVAGLIFTAAGLFDNQSQFFYSYLNAYLFWITVSLGGLFFIMLHHLTGSEWSIVLRRIMETVASTIPVMALLFIPVIWGMYDLYHWSHEDAVVSDVLLQKKSAYLNPAFFIIRAVFYFAIWSLLSLLLYKTSLAQDNAFDNNQVTKMRKVSAPGMVAFALTITFAGFDWAMSLDAHWYSTIFGVYIFGGSFLAILCFLVVFGLFLRKRNILDNTITVEHYHDIGKFLFGFIIFWGYIGFSQYFLIWYANIPEETIWYLHRWEGSWKYITMILVFAHFLIPFIALMPRFVKRNLSLMRFIALWILVMHWLDIYWLVIPNLHHHSVHFSWMDLTATFGIGGIFFWYFWTKFSANATVPVNDPNLEKSIRMVNN